MLKILLVILLVGVLVAAYDLIQKKHAILRNFPIIGHFRYWLEMVGPELRQYIVTSNDEERPFSRDERRWVYASSKKENNLFGFGTDNDLELTANQLILKHTTFPYKPSSEEQANLKDTAPISSLKVLGEWRAREKKIQLPSVINISAMSFGSLSSAAVEALNRGSKLCGCFQNTGEGSISPYHQKGGDLIWQIGTGYFGCRDAQGNFSRERLLETIAANAERVKAIEIKLSQGAKPGKGGVLPAEKVSTEIAKIRGIPVGKTCVSPSYHTAFSDVDSLLDFVESLAELTGLPVGVKSAVGQDEFWHDLADHMEKDRNRGVDFITIDGGEGGTGAAPLVFSDHVALPFKIGFTRIYRIFAEHSLNEKVFFFGSGKLGFSDVALLAFALGCDAINVGREAMLSIGCIQAQRCHTGACPTGVATQNRWLARGLDPSSKAVRLANYVAALRKELLELSYAMGVSHPSLVKPDNFEILDANFGSRSPLEVFQYEPEWRVSS